MSDVTQPKGSVTDVLRPATSYPNAVMGLLKNRNHRDQHARSSEPASGIVGTTGDGSVTGVRLNLSPEIVIGVGDHSTKLASVTIGVRKCRRRNQAARVIVVARHISACIGFGEFFSGG